MSASISPASVIQAVREQVSCEIDGEAVVLNLRDGVYYSLNPVGAKLWTLLQDHRTLRELCDALLQEYPGLEAERCESDVLRLISQMAEWELVEIGNTVET
ncbi:MAG: PqqD family protein [Gemmatimonadetes bacterium]|nr:PqqD family protein [Gemmatimonadota bacterium]